MGEHGEMSTLDKMYGTIRNVKILVGCVMVLISIIQISISVSSHKKLSDYSSTIQDTIDDWERFPFVDLQWIHHSRSCTELGLKWTQVTALGKFYGHYHTCNLTRVNATKQDGSLLTGSCVQYFPWEKAGSLPYYEGHQLCALYGSLSAHERAVALPDGQGGYKCTTTSSSKSGVTWQVCPGTRLCWPSGEGCPIVNIRALTTVDTTELTKLALNMSSLGLRFCNVSDSNQQSAMGTSTIGRNASARACDDVQQTLNWWDVDVNERAGGLYAKNTTTNVRYIGAPSASGPKWWILNYTYEPEPTDVSSKSNVLLRARPITQIHMTDDHFCYAINSAVSSDKVSRTYPTVPTYRAYTDAVVNTTTAWKWYNSRTCRVKDARTGVLDTQVEKTVFRTNGLPFATGASKVTWQLGIHNEVYWKENCQNNKGRNDLDSPYARFVKLLRIHTGLIAMAVISLILSVCSLGFLISKFPERLSPEPAPKELDAMDVEEKSAWQDALRNKESQDYQTKAGEWRTKGRFVVLIGGVKNLATLINAVLGCISAAWAIAQVGAWRELLNGNCMDYHVKESLSVVKGTLDSVRGLDLVLAVVNTIQAFVFIAAYLWDLKKSNDELAVAPAADE